MKLLCFLWCFCNRPWLHCFFVPIFFFAHLASKSQQKTWIWRIAICIAVIWGSIRHLQVGFGKTETAAICCSSARQLLMRMRSGVALRDWEDEIHWKRRSLVPPPGKLLVTCPLGHWQVSARDLSWDDKEGCDGMEWSSPFLACDWVVGVGWFWGRFCRLEMLASTASGDHSSPWCQWERWAWLASLCGTWWCGLSSTLIYNGLKNIWNPEKKRLWM